MKYRNIDRNFRSTVTVAYRYNYRENVALKSQVWGSLTLAQLLGECSTLWGERERGSVVGMGVYVSSHRKLIGHFGCCCSPQLLAFSAGRAQTG